MTTTESFIPADTFGFRLLHLRKELGLTVEQIARQVGVPHPTWTTWENGAKPRDIVSVVGKVCATTGCDREWLMWGSNFSTLLTPLDVAA